MYENPLSALIISKSCLLQRRLLEQLEGLCARQTIGRHSLCLKIRLRYNSQFVHPAKLNHGLMQMSKYAGIQRGAAKQLDSRSKLLQSPLSELTHLLIYKGSSKEISGLGAEYSLPYLTDCWNCPRTAHPSPDCSMPSSITST